MNQTKLMQRVRLDAATGCWLWRGSISKAGLPVRDGRSARREFYTVFVGPVPTDKFVTFGCDEERCVCPYHSEICTKAGYIKRAIHRGTSYGNAMKSAKVALTCQKASAFTWSDIRAMRARFHAGEGQTALAAEFGTSPSNAHLIVNNKTWREVGSPLALLARQAGMLP